MTFAPHPQMCHGCGWLTTHCCCPVTTLQADAQVCPIRCKITNNPCGTDTWKVGSPCRCEHCQYYLMMKSLRAAIHTYGDHAQHCWLNSGRAQPNDHCDCGFSTALEL